MMRWRDRALCRSKGIDSFFAGATTLNGRQAITLCLMCPVRQSCLDDCLALEKTDNMRIGIRGGMAPNTRSAYVKVSRRG